MNKIEFSERGTVNLPLGGVDRRLRFRTHEISQLEKQMGKGIMALISEDNLGLTFLKNAIAVGVAHEFVSTRKSKRKPLTEKMVSGWIDDCEKYGVEFDELLSVVVKAVVSGLPSGQKYMDEWDKEDEENGDEGNVEGPEGQ